MSIYTSEKKDDTLVFHFEGELDTVSCMEIEEQILTEIKAHKNKVIFDLKNVEFVASSFIRLCGSAAHLIGAEYISITNMRKEIKKVLKKVGLTSVLKIS